MAEALVLSIAFVTAITIICMTIINTPRDAAGPIPYTGGKPAFVSLIQYVSGAW
jgi:hypothetical protein